jgi:hypothetical protein
VPETTPTKREPQQAEPSRRALHAVIAIAGWIVFGYWWWLVFRRVNATEVRYTVWFLGVALFVIVLVTALWALHNKMLFRRLGPRTKLRDVAEDFSRDTVGRPVDMPAVPEECLTADVIVIRIEGHTKVYQPVEFTHRPPGPHRLKVVS